jgi:hypothetical protein
MEFFIFNYTTNFQEGLFVVNAFSRFFVIASEARRSRCLGLGVDNSFRLGKQRHISGSPRRLLTPCDDRNALLEANDAYEAVTGFNVHDSHALGCTRGGSD